MPDLLSNTQWLYADIFLPIFLPTLDLNNNARPLSSARTFMDILNNNNNNNNNTNNQTTAVPALDYVDIELFSSNQTLSNATNSTVSIREKRSVDSTATRPSPVAVLTTRIAQILQATTANSTERSGRVEFDLANYPAISSLLGGSLAGGASNFNSNLIAGLLKTTPSVQAAKTTTAKAAAAAASSGSSVDINPFSLYDLITSINSGNALTSTTGLLQMITPLFALLPLDQLFPQNTKEQNLAIVSTLPEVIKIIQFFNTFQVLSIEVK